MLRDRERPIEPWPIALAIALILGIGVGITFFAIAWTHPDPVVSHESRPGMEP